MLACLLQIEGRENLPEKDEAAVYVANHQSFLVSVNMSGIAIAVMDTCLASPLPARDESAACAVDRQSFFSFVQCCYMKTVDLELAHSSVSGGHVFSFF